MKVLIVNTSDRGGAANACARLHLALMDEEGVDSTLLLKNKYKNIALSEQWKRNSKTPSLWQKVWKKAAQYRKRFFSSGDHQKKKTPQETFLEGRSKTLESYSFPATGIDITHSKLYQEADVINLHWVAEFVDFEDFFKKSEKPVVWTLHDMNPFLPGEHYKEVWDGITQDGFPVNRAISEAEEQWNERNMQLKREALKQVQNLTIVAPSQWLVKEARDSELFGGYPVHHIPYGLNTDVFKLRDRSFARDFFNIPENQKVLLFVADSLSNNRKGFAYLAKAIQQLEDKEVLLCAVGKLDASIKGMERVRALGSITDERVMSLAYNAADAFVIPSLMDNLPNTVLESLACGTPVIGFPVGGIVDMVQPGTNGMLTSEISVQALAKTIESYLDGDMQFDRSHISAQAKAKYDQHIQAKAYHSLFASLMDEENTTSYV